MTSFAFIFGVVPLVLAEGAGAEMRRSLGTAVFGGMLGVTSSASSSRRSSITSSSGSVKKEQESTHGESHESSSQLELAASVRE